MRTKFVTYVMCKYRIDVHASKNSYTISDFSGFVYVVYKLVKNIIKNRWNIRKCVAMINLKNRNLHEILMAS